MNESILTNSTVKVSNFFYSYPKIHVWLLIILLAIGFPSYLINIFILSKKSMVIILFDLSKLKKYYYTTFLIIDS